MDIEHTLEDLLVIVSPNQSQVTIDEPSVLKVNESLMYHLNSNCGQQLDSLSLKSALPVEILFEIFTLATDFHNFDPPPPDGRTAYDLIAEWKESIRFRKGLLRVCQTWRFAGLPFIFEHIVITEIPQLARIVHLLKLRIIRDDGRKRLPFDVRL